MSRAPVTYYQSLLTSEYQNATKRKAWLGALLTIADDIAACSDSMNAAFDLATAVGVQLDTLGQIIGVGRVIAVPALPGEIVSLPDEDYRLLLRAKIAQNHWNGQIGSLYALWQELFPNGFISLIDNQDMTATIILAGDFTTNQLIMIEAGLIVPRPQGVLYDYVFASMPYFGFDLDTSLIAGFDKGHWV